MPDTFMTQLPEETLAELRWLASSRVTIAIVDKPVLRALLDAYEAQVRVLRGLSQGGE